jgi:MYXO-CTERM domain-containing protein
MTSRALAATTLAALLLLATPSSSRAFCGFYVGGAGSSLYANATMVVLLRDGNRTVLSMQNDYQGPPEDFAMVIPVPVVLHEDDVRTLPRELFQRIDTLAAPRLVEYWEHDPCAPEPPIESVQYSLRVATEESESPSGGEDLQVRVEARFAVAEYDVVILSAGDSAGLETWLHREHYNIPEGASAVLRPYVEAGTKFFVARIDPSRVTFEDGRAVLSPLRFHYDTPDFWLPVRLGLLSSRGQQDLIVHVLARGQRYEVANYDNVTIPTNLRVVDAVRDELGGFYEWVFRETIAHNARTVVTEYAWDSMSCDPCPGPVLSPEDVMTLGADVISDRQPYGFTLTRLHYRYGPEDLTEDLVFRAAPPIRGGQGIPSADGTMEQGAVQSEYGQNTFQGRYVILHPWEGEISCESPQRGRWGGPPGTYRGSPPPTFPSGNGAMASGIASSTMQGDALLAGSIQWSAGQASQASTSLGGTVPLAPRGGCATCAVGTGGERAVLALGGLALVALALGRRRRAW